MFFAVGGGDRLDALEGLDRLDALEGLDALDRLEGLEGIDALEGIDRIGIDNTIKRYDNEVNRKTGNSSDSAMYVECVVVW